MPPVQITSGMEQERAQEGREEGELHFNFPHLPTRQSGFLLLMMPLIFLARQA